MRWIGYGLCHQLPERSFFGGGVQVPVCARDTGIYLGFIVSLVVISLVHRGERPRSFPGPATWAVMAVMLAVFGWDGVSSYAGFRETTNGIRLITGLGVGFGAAAIIAPILNDQLWARSSAGRLFSPAWRLWAWIGAIPVTWAAIWWGAPMLGSLYPALVTGAILFSLAMINLVVVSMHSAFDRKAHGVSDLLTPGAISLVLAVLEVWGAGALRDLLVRASSILT